MRNEMLTGRRGRRHRGFGGGGRIQAVARRQPVLAGLALAAGLSGAALAHSGVKNETVRERMALMVRIKDAVAVLGGMVKGEIGHDAARAEAARTALIAQAERIPAVFEASESDPKSEALPLIWTEWQDFAARAETMVHAARAIDGGSAATIRKGMNRLGKSCSGCHKHYRIAQ